MNHPHLRSQKRTSKNKNCQKHKNMLKNKEHEDFKAKHTNTKRHIKDT